ncbi:MAG: DUF501 domain-containing protein [Athalassotoga sp.]|uniref:DUF501 domain-containing protein n=2 Tax=Athalassotoga sp. TaxID=2022597 RepID=UPI003D00211E
MISNEEMKIVTNQIGRVPENALNVAKYCSYGFPTVIKSYPLLDGKPFPTLYWLTCPFLRDEISKMESDGWIKRYEEMISKSSEFSNLQIKAHELAKKDVIDLLQDDDLKIKFTGGMGGIRNFNHVKCLHMHVAYHLGGIENPVGRSVLSKISQTECKSGICLEWSI